MNKGKLFLLPTVLSESEITQVIPNYNITLIQSLKYFIAEDAKTARRFLKLCGYPAISEAEIVILNEHTQTNSYKDFLKPIWSGHSIGLMSDAGCPGIADPGADVISEAHLNLIDVIPLVGPSSIVLTIMASGFNGQNFAFVGYLPIEKGVRIKRIKELELLAQKLKQAQYFIETPYRNKPLFQDLLDNLQQHTKICLGINLTDKNQKIITKTVIEWRKSNVPELHKIPVVFGVYF